MQVHSRKLGDIGHGKSSKWYIGIGIAIIVVAILVAIAILSPHQAAGTSLIGQICYHKSVHLCLLLPK
jgi:hypothetical protein